MTQMTPQEIVHELDKHIIGQGEAIARNAKKSVKVLVVGNPANTNALIARENAKSYRRLDFRSRPDECVQLAIWPIPGGKVGGFHVVLVTVRPSS